MTKLDDVAAYVLKKTGPLSAMKLQKLVYYSYAWHLVWDEERLFDGTIEAWANGPVVRELYRNHRGQFSVDSWPLGDASALTKDEAETIDVIVETYGEMTAHQLSQLTHREAPWQDARRGFDPGAWCNVEITDAAIFEYYDGLAATLVE